MTSSSVKVEKPAIWNNAFAETSCLSVLELFIIVVTSVSVNTFIHLSYTSTPLELLHAPTYEAWSLYLLVANTCILL